MGHGKPCECGLAQAPPWPWVVQGQGPGRAGGILFECHMEAEGRGPPRLDEACARRIAYCGNRLCAHTRTGTQCRSPALVGASIRDVHHTANSAAMLCKRTELLLFVAKILGDDPSIVSRDISRSVCTLRHWSQSVHTRSMTPYDTVEGSAKNAPADSWQSTLLISTGAAGGAAAAFAAVAGTPSERLRFFLPSTDAAILACSDRQFDDGSTTRSGIVDGQARCRERARVIERQVESRFRYES